MGLFSAIGKVVGRVVTGVKTFVNNAKTGKAAIQAGFTIKGGADTDAAKAVQSIWKTIPVYVWGIVIFIVALLVAIVSGAFRGRK